MSADPSRPAEAPAELDVRWLGRRPYLEVLEAQRARRREVQTGGAPEALWLAEHDWVLTTGRRAVPDLPDERFWADKGIPVVRTERGGLATLHGPGQIVAALVIDLRRRGLGVKRTVRALESGIISWLARLDIDAGRRDGAPGVWVDRDKIASVGLHIQRDVTLHGFAVNLAVPLEPFGWFTPCGVADAGTTSVLERTGREIPLRDSAFALADSVRWSILESIVDSPRGVQ